ncbi:hypothetical protein SDRG_01134 [Saprolegnia diclina VS20]|uniref:Alpha/beta hydrolase n=1 Tax=Saprolegnia diclina (strain VS20) TaxID=1156394 RepID=T0R2G5_SAPDV|nr:hypothetical protein SDRG_01134 [Saprolegnia diclina VS20]EQC41156.1 hypothetical protein SDRG_01134 [Saprolegnia diclina VS20]|eukprot:XP_008604870.1 hypothetical protein SDRG_01134 [Saprolegnia diclina VS20]
MKRPRILLLVPAADDSNWYPWLAAKLDAAKCKVVLRCAMTPLAALRDECDRDTIVLGHRSGAGLALRLTEQAQVLGLILVAPYLAGPPRCTVGSVHSHLHDDSDAFQYTKVRRNCGWILHLGSPDDLYTPTPAQIALAQTLHSDFYFLPGRAQYTTIEAHDLWAVLAAKLPPL